MFSIDQIALFIQALMPGAIAVYVRDRFVQRPKMPFAELAPAYVVLSALYFGTLFLIVEPEIVFNDDIERTLWRPALDLAAFFLGPAIFGLAIGFLGQLRLPERLAKILGIAFIDPLPTAWDFKFAGTRKDEYVSVFLRQGETVIGYFGERSLAASDLARRDIYVETIYQKAENGDLTSTESVGVWINGEDIVKIEFRPYIDQIKDGDDQVK